MQIFNDRKKRIGTLSGFKDRAITTTLDSGDKEMTFAYPASGALVGLLQEEYYIRTKTDEFVIKAVEKGEQFNKYTAVLNVEELEGTAFPYGFESDEQTIRACLEFAFEGTGWHVGTCTVTKKRTIDEQENITAWDVLQKCLSTYRCECIIDSINKTVNIYERIGSDKGCYFIEGINLRKISLKSDTYDFYTRIYPIGKDGITPEWLTGKDYIDNFQYSSKVKAYVWKDERYTNTTSLIEDATAKIEEMSRPYKAYTAEVVDLAKASEEYKDILSYGIGDTVTLVSKRTRTKEKQRIVKITEYPETPKKNTVEISNARKTFERLYSENKKEKIQNAKQYFSNFSKEKDEFQDVVWYYHKNMPEYIDIRSYVIPFFYIEDDNVKIQIRYNYTGDDWIFFKQVTILADGKKYNKTFDYFNITHNNEAGSVWEYISEEADEYDIEMLRAIAKSKTAKVRYEGDDYIHDITINNNDKKIIKDVLKIYDAYN